jgi:coenzyme F420-reducing hydrogenase alpha subunit
MRIEVPFLTRVEGEGALHVRIADGQIEDLRLEIFEPHGF